MQQGRKVNGLDWGKPFTSIVTHVKHNTKVGIKASTVSLLNVSTDFPQSPESTG